MIVNATVHGTDNRVALDAIAVSDNRYRGVASIDGGITEQGVRALRRRLSRLPLQLRAPSWRHARHERVPPHCCDGGVVQWHIDLHFDAVDLPDFADMLAKLPVRYTIDHMARVTAADGLDQRPFKILLELLGRDPKCWVKVSGFERVSSAGPPFHDAIPFARKLVETAPDRIIWGTDWPHPNVKVMPNDGDLVDLIPLFAPEVELQHKVLVDNPARLFDFPR